jgi:hypothetical protein
VVIVLLLVLVLVVVVIVLVVVVVVVIVCYPGGRAKLPSGAGRGYEEHRLEAYATLIFRTVEPISQSHPATIYRTCSGEATVL